jgi:hypothetical protein
MTDLLTGADRLVLYVLVGVGIVLLIVPGGGGEPLAVRIEGADGYRTEVPLTSDRRFEVPGPLGETTVVLEGGAARVESSPCPHGVCIATGTVRRPGEVAVCVPNRVVVRILGENEWGMDALTR